MLNSFLQALEPALPTLESIDFSKRLNDKLLVYPWNCAGTRIDWEDGEHNHRRIDLSTFNIGDIPKADLLSFKCFSAPFVYLLFSAFDHSIKIKSDQILNNWHQLNHTAGDDFFVIALNDDSTLHGVLECKFF